MAADDLNTPLGLKPPPAPRPLRSPVRPYAIAAFLVPVGIVGLTLAFLPGGFSFRPLPAPAETKVVSPETTASIRPAPSSDEDKGIKTRRVGNAKIIEIPDDDGATAGGAVVIRDIGVAPEGLPELAEDDLLERTSKGLIPRVSDKGRRPLDAYSRPRPGGRVLEGPKVAIVVGGLGIDEASTSAAITGLPGTITLAFAPYGTELSRLVAQARRQGHELLLQLPLEPFDYPRQDPGPQTLLVSATPVQNRDRLYTLLSRFRTYVGVVNHMGARFSSETTAMAPLLNEIGRRGLLYLDDGSSPRSRAGEVAAGTRTPFVSADVTIDGRADAAAIDAQLDLLVRIAKERGKAIGMASAFPLTIDRLAAWTRSAAAKNVTLVPISALTTSPPS